MAGVLKRSFFDRDTTLVARQLIGMRLVRILPDGHRLSGTIVETEAYLPGDAASHACRGPSQRNAAMFMQAGTSYVYFTYGVHFCFNIVTECAGQPAAVLIRSLEPDEGIEQMRQYRMKHRHRAIAKHELCRGPACVCQALQIDRTLDRYDMLQGGSILFVEQDTSRPDHEVCNTPRIRVRGDQQALDRLWRWAIKDNACVSR